MLQKFLDIAAQKQKLLKTVARKEGPSRNDNSIVFVVAATIILALLLYIFWSGYQTNRHDAFVAVRNSVEALASNIESVLEHAESDVRVIVRQVTAADLSGRISAPRRAELEAAMSNNLRSFPAIYSYRVFDATGESEFGAGPGNPHANFSVADRVWFQQLRDNPTSDLVLSDVVVSKTVNQPTIIMGVAIRDSQGRFLGAADASINLGYFQNRIEQPDLGPGGFVAVLRADNFHLVLHRPRMDADLNEVQTGGVADIITEGKRLGRLSGNGDFVAPLDQVERTYAYWFLDRFPFAVAVGISPDDYLRAWRRQVALGGIGAVVLVGVLTVLFRRQRMAQRQLVDAALRHRALMQTATDGIHIMNEDGNLLDASASFYRMLGYSPDHPPSMTIGDWDTHFIADGGARKMLAMTVEGDGFVQRRHRRADGSEIDVEIAASMIALGGKPLIYASSRDITARKQIEAERQRAEVEHARAERQAREQSMFLDVLLESIPMPLFFKDDECRYLGCNRAFEEFFGAPRQPLIGKSVYEIAPSEDARKYDEADRELIARGGTQVYEWNVQRPDGQVRRVIFQKATFPRADGTVGGIVGSLMDVTESREKEEKLLHSNAELEQFSYVISHDLREPLRMINSYIGLLDRRYHDAFDDDAREFMRFARDGAQRMDKMVLDLLQLSRIGRIGGSAAPVALTEVITSALDNLALAINEASAEITVATDMPIVTGSHDELVRLFQNIVGNAVKYRRKDISPVISIAAERAERKWVVSISDNGIGIAPEFFERIFGVFQRLHGQGEYEGTGIGLAVCKKIVEHHGGRIWVESAPGSGTTFFFTLPDGSTAS